MAQQHSLPCRRLSADLLFLSSLSQPIKDAAVAAKSLQLCTTLCDPIDGSPPGSAIPGILQARTLEWVAISFSTLKMRDRQRGRRKKNKHLWMMIY